MCIYSADVYIRPRTYHMHIYTYAYISLSLSLFHMHIRVIHRHTQVSAYSNYNILYYMISYLKITIFISYYSIVFCGFQAHQRIDDMDQRLGPNVVTYSVAIKGRNGGHQGLKGKPGTATCCRAWRVKNPYMIRGIYS